MRPTFSEFTFGFGISREILKLLEKNTIRAPVFPSLLEEADLGYDVKFSFIGSSLFLQFKTSDYLEKPNAKYWNEFKGPHFRFRLYRLDRSSQHNRLVLLAEKEPHVYYCAPLFNSEADFSTFFLKEELSDKSVAVPLGKLGVLTDTRQHHFVYTASIGMTKSPSNEPLALSSIRQTIATLLEQYQGVRISMEYLQTLLRELMTIIVRRDTRPPSIEYNLEDPIAIIRAIRLILRTYFGAEWILTERPPRRNQYGREHRDNSGGTPLLGNA